MPLLQTQDVYTLRIQAGQIEIRRVYLDSTLLWGLYDVTYHLAGGTQGSNPIGEYVWGVADENLPKPSWPNQTYYTKFQGWYEGTTYVTAIPAITRDFHKDLDLYAKWTQRKYTYSGTYMWQWTEVIHHEGDGGDTEEESASGVTFSAITTTNPTYWKIGQCTRWCLRRTESAFGSPALNSNRDAKNWILSNSDFGDGWSPIPGGSPQPGDVVVFGPSKDNPYGHVLFQETDSIITQSNVRYPGGSWADWWISHGYKEWDSVYQVWRPEHELYSCVNIGKPSSYLGSSRLGVVRYYGSGGGGGGGGGGGWDEVVTHTEYGNVAETDCPTQKPPAMPNPPKGSWTQTQQNTYTRDYNYNSNTWGSWNLASSSWDTSGSDWI